MEKENEAAWSLVRTLSRYLQKAKAGNRWCSHIRAFIFDGVDPTDLSQHFRLLVGDESYPGNREL